MRTHDERMNKLVKRRFQAGLGSEIKRVYKEGQQINTLLLAQVIQVNYKYNTVDLLALQHKEVFQNSYANEGRFSARLPMEFGGRNIVGQPYGQVNPIAVGTVVLVGFINSDKDMPIVISVYNNNDVSKQLSRTQFSNSDPKDLELIGDMHQKFSLYPSLTYDSVDGEGGRVVTFSGKSFIAFDTKEVANSSTTDAGYGTKYEDLETSYYNNGDLIEPMKGRAPNVLFKHQGVLDDDGKPDLHDLLIHINPDGTYRTSMMNKEEDWRTLFEMTPDGRVKLRKQDSINIDGGIEISELGINNEGFVYLRNGDMDLEVRKDGIYSQGKLFTADVDLSDVYDKLNGLSIQIKETNGQLEIIANGVEEQNGKISELSTEITIVAGKVESKVTKTEVQDMIDSSFVDMSDAIKKAQEDADKANKVIADMSSDNRLTPSEKIDLLKEWDIIKNEYPSYLEQAETYEVDSKDYTAKYNSLELFVTPILADMESTSSVDGATLRKTFNSYYTARIALLNSISKKLKDGITEAMKKASQASLDATQAMADASQAKIDADNANKLISDIASDNKLTPSEKYQLKKEWDVIVKEYPTTIAQAEKYAVDTAEYTAKYKALELFVEPLFKDMDETSIVDGERLRATFSDYYASKIALLKEVTDSAKTELDAYGNKISVMETNITQTSEAITLLATRVQTVEDGVQSNKAQIEIQAEQISQKVTASEVKGIVDDSINNLTLGGTNLFVIKTQTAGLLNENDGTVGTAVDNSVVSDYIKVNQKTPYIATLYGNTGTNMIITDWYDKNRTFISGEAVADSGGFSKKYVSPENAVYARVSYKKANSVNIKFEAGTKATDYSPSWEDIKGDQTALEEYIKKVEEQAKKAQQDAENAKNDAENANNAIADMSNDNMLAPNEKKQILLQWEQIKTEYPINLDQATKFGVSSQQYTTAYNALDEYLKPILADMTTTSVVVGSTLRNTFNNYYDKRTTLLNRISDVAKNVADKAQETADTINDNLQNIGGYNYVGFSSGDNMLPRLMIKNVGYYTLGSSTTEFIDSMVAVKGDATTQPFDYTVGTSDKEIAGGGLADYRMKEIKEGQWLTASANVQVIGGGSARLAIYTLEGDNWVGSNSTPIQVSDGLKRVVAQRKVTGLTKGVLIRIESADTNVKEFRFGNVQLEVGIIPTPWKKSDIDIQEDINNVVQNIKTYTAWANDLQGLDFTREKVEGKTYMYVGTSMKDSDNYPDYTWRLTDEHIEGQINGKEGAWIYSPTAPTNPSQGLIWVDLSKVPNQPKRWVDSETGWVALTPEEVKDLPWGEDGTSLADWVSQAEQRISSDSIINTVLGSEDFTSVFDTKANTSDLGNLATYEDLDSIKEDYNRLIKEGINGIDFTPYVTNSELQQLKDSFNFSVQQAGGVNMLKNSLGFSGLDFWNGTVGKNLLPNSTWNLGFGRWGGASIASFEILPPEDDKPTSHILGSISSRSSTKEIGNRPHPLKVNSGETYTISFDYKEEALAYNKDRSILVVRNYPDKDTDQWMEYSIEGWAVMANGSTTDLTVWRRFTKTFTIGTSGYLDILPKTIIQSWEHRSFWRELKIEKGTQATTWVPNKEDGAFTGDIVETIQTEELANLGFGSGFISSKRPSSSLTQSVELPEIGANLEYSLSFYMKVTTDNPVADFKCGIRVYDGGTLTYTLGIEDATQPIPLGFQQYKLVFTPTSTSTKIEMFVENGQEASVIISGIMYNIGSIPLKWQPYPSEIYNTNVKIDINGVTVKNNQTDGYTMITPQEFSGYSRIDGNIERIFTLNGQVTEVKMLKAEKRITMEPVSVFAMNTVTDTKRIRGWAFVPSFE